MPWRINIQNAKPSSAREFINGDALEVSDNNAQPQAKKEFSRIRSAMQSVVDALPKEGVLVSFHGGGNIEEDGMYNGTLSWSTTVVPKNLYSMYTW